MITWTMTEQEVGTLRKLIFQESSRLEQVTTMTHVHSEYLGILVVLRELKATGVTGRVLVTTDGSRCVHALRRAIGLKVKPHSKNQEPRVSDFGGLFDESVTLLIELKNAGCFVEFVYKHRSYINDFLQIGGRTPRHPKDHRNARVL